MKLEKIFDEFKQHVNSMSKQDVIDSINKAKAASIDDIIALVNSPEHVDKDLYKVFELPKVFGHIGTILVGAANSIDADMIRHELRKDPEYENIIDWFGEPEEVIGLYSDKRGIMYDGSIDARHIL